MLKRTFATLAAVLIATSSPSAWSQVKDIAWGTSPVGTTGHKALVVLADVLNKEMPNYRITVQPTPGAVITVKGYATGEYAGFYGSDIAFYEFANDIDRFKGFKANAKRQPMQSFWAYTLEVGTAVHSRNKDKIKTWADLSGKRVFTGPLPFDVRAHLERAYRALGVKFQYVNVDLSTVGSLAESGSIDAFCIYTSAETVPPPWLAEASLAADWAVLNPSASEIVSLKEKGFPTTEIKPAAFNKNVHADKVILFPFFYGFHVGPEVPESDVYKMLTLIEKNTATLAKADSSYGQIAKDMASMQRRGVESSVEFVPIHPGLARYMREKGVWDAKWDSKVATK